MKFVVYGTVQVGVTIEVEAEDKDDAIEVASNEFGGLTGYAGNGGMGKLVGTTQKGVTLDAGDDYGDFTEAEPVE